VRVLTWNVAGRVRSVPEQAAVLPAVAADVVALQEVRATALPAWERALRAQGHEHVVCSLPVAGAPTGPERRLGVLVASREPVVRRPAAAVPWPERYLVAEVAGVELHVLHAPISQRAGQVKVLTLEAVHAALAPPSALPRVLVGDLNTPQYESREGEVRTFARTRGGAIRASHGERHDRAELLLVTGLREHGFLDAFRTLHGYGARDRSWMPRGRPGPGYRLDHVLARGLRVDGCAYVHAWREAGLSDHSGMWADLS
jgi:endonuclease/exonuclease/phosphatase family metal-dependent hydrolase